MTFGVTTEGFVAKDLETVLSELAAEEENQFGIDIVTEADSVLGQLNGIFGAKIAELWQVALAVYRSRQRDSASGEALDNVGALTGALRLPPRESTVTLTLNLDAGTTVPTGSIVSIGPSGTRWVTLADAENAAAFEDDIDVAAESEDEGAFVGNAYAIDTISTPVAGWAANAAITTPNDGPYPLKDFQTLLLQIDGGDTQTAVFNTADFADISNATAAEVISVITTDVSGIGGTAIGGTRIRLFSTTNGSGSSVRVVGGTALAALGFTKELRRGFNPSRSAKIINATNETYDLSGAPTLFVSVDRGAFQTVTFGVLDIGEKASGRLSVVAASLLASGVDTDTFVLNDGVNPAVTFIYDDDSSVTEDAVTRAIAYTGIENASQMRALTVQAINNAPTLDITAESGTSDELVFLENDAVGTAGNVAITETVADAGFTVFGMAGGTASDPANATALKVAEIISDSVSGAFAYVVNGKVQIESETIGVNSYIEITGGTAAATLGYTVDEEQGGSSGAAELGRGEELDSAYRIRQEQLLRLAGSAALEPVRAAVQNVDGVRQAFVFENFSNITDAAGRPAKSFEVVVDGGNDTAIAQAIFDEKPLGILPFRSPGADGRTVAITDSQGVDHDIGFTRPTEIQMHVEVDVEVTQADFGAGSQVNGEQEIREALKALGDNLTIGEDIKILRFRCAPLDVTGVEDVTDIKIEAVDPPTNTANIVIPERSLATFATADIDINVTFV